MKHTVQLDHFFKSDYGDILWPKMPKASISIDFDSKILPEATFFKLEHSIFFSVHQYDAPENLF